MLLASHAAVLHSPPGSAPVIICVDLDGTLLRGDVLWESFVDLLKARPLAALACLLSLFAGKASFKRAVARCTQLDPATLPYRRDLLAHLAQQRAAGAHLVLATACDAAQAEAIAAHLGIFAEVLASDGTVNLSGRRKARVLCERYGHGRFAYIGNDWADVPVWAAASASTAVGASPRLLRHVGKRHPIDTIGTTDALDGPRPSPARSLVTALRPYQWVKNLAIFVPLIAGHKIGQLDLWAASALTFVVFCLCASAIYLLNDIWDIKADRAHPRKRRRPFAAGHLSIPAGAAAAVGLLAASLLLAGAAISWLVALIAAAYVASTTAYTLVLKRLPVADVFALTGLYVLRVVAGGAATDTPPSSWLLGFALFFFLSLAFVKRYAELTATAGWIAGRGYCQEDRLWMHAIGTTAGYMAVLVLALYVTAPEVTELYRRPQVLWLLCPILLFWVTRVWFRAGRGAIHDDPVVEALRDPMSYLVGIAATAIVVAAL